MQDHSTHLRGQIPDFADYETRFGDETLLNCGIIGGNAALMFDFITRLWSIHQHANHANETAFTGDMGAFNYLARTQFNGQTQARRSGEYGIQEVRKRAQRLLVPT